MNVGNETDEIINMMADFNLKKIDFNMDELTNIIAEIDKSIIFQNLCQDKLIDNIINWIKNNPRHSFPKCHQAWTNLIFLQFRRVKIYINSEFMINNIEQNFSSIDINLQILADSIKKFINKKKNIKLTKNELIKKVGTFSYIDINFEPDKIFQILVQKNIINPVNLSIQSNEINKKRKRDDEDKYLRLDNLNFKKMKNG